MQMPKIGLGTFRLKDQIVIDSVLAGLEVGYRHIDTAQIYENEAEVAQAIAQSGVSRNELYLTTKIWTANLSKTKLIDSLKISLDKLQTDQLDLTLIHWPSPNNAVAVAEYMEALALAKQQGLTREIGVSNFTVAHLQQAVDAVGAEQIANQQIELHPFLQSSKVVAFCQQHDIAITAYMPLAYGKVMHEPVLQHIASGHQATAAQVSLAWLLQRGFSVIPSSTQRSHLQSNLQAGKLLLSAAEMQVVAGLDKNERIVAPDFGPVWD